MQTTSRVLRAVGKYCIISAMEKCFNIAGPCFPDEHYMLPALERLPGIMRIVEQRSYFVLHAARQSGKTTVLMALVEEINQKGEMNALYFTVETVQRFTDPRDGIPKIVERMRSALVNNPVFKAFAVSGASQTTDVREFLSGVAAASEKPLVVFFDEVDCLSDDTLVTFLRQLRDGYVTRRSSPFPASIALVGMRDIRDYKARIRPDGQTLGDASPFNIITEDLTLGNFTENDIVRLYAQHTEATGQVFEPEAVERTWQLTRGQPWLVNALARECVMKIHDGRYDEPITVDDIATAKEKIIRKNPVHLDYLFYIARHPSVRPFLDAALNGSITDAQREERQFRLLLLLGLLCECNDRFEFSNPIYKTYWDRCKGD